MARLSDKFFVFLRLHSSRSLSSSTMPLFIANFGSTLDELGEIPPEGEEPNIVDSVESFVRIFAIIGAVAGVAGFTMVSLWSIAGERQVWICDSASPDA